MARQVELVSRIKANAATILVIGTVVLGVESAGASEPTIRPPFLTTPYATLPLSSPVTATSCDLRGCIHADGTIFVKPRLDQRLKATFRGIATLTVPENTDAVLIRYGRRQPTVEYSTRPTVIWAIPGSGTYSMTITLKWHNESTHNEATYVVPLWVPRTP